MGVKSRMHRNINPYRRNFKLKKEALYNTASKFIGLKISTINGYLFQKKLIMNFAVPG